ncbi:BTAD domain-containing putative transcriptional regulator [Embleya scabrispora]|uniref:BTAD domain-containing putative transcriptional regulator n=1 Tax=Embleya scabrispora TaxID=159449 RepID=UPI000369A163|nr:BTAD domain-containing putative transcriptional regulator [Embleya scabrispora]MYS83578.1 AAA family ATPase [Streptomyces sp. SID5474]
MRFGVMGPLAVWTADGQPVRVPESKVRALLADLLVHRGRPVSADLLVEDLWGADPPGNPANTLQTKVSQLRRALEAGEPGGRELVVHRPPGYQLRVDADAVDADRFAELTARARAGADVRTRAGLLADALALWRGPAFADFRDEEFARAAITRLDEQRLTAIEDYAEARLELGEYTALADELGEQVALHPVRERLRAAHLRALYRSGRQEEALAGYAELRERLAEELGLDPGPELAALHRAILAQDPSLTPVAAPAGAATGAPTGVAAGVAAHARARSNLPAALTELVGREEAAAEVDGLLRSARLVTLTGPGGVGKTRLALESAARAVDDPSFPDGVWLVELAGRRDPSGDDLADAIASALGIRDEATAGAGHRAAESRTRLADALRGRGLLLVLDNCEHVIEPIAELADLLLRAAPELRILATSREPLAVGGEVLCVVRPLAVPAAGADPTALAESTAVRLFVARAAAAAPGFVLDGHTADAVAAICRRLDGIPLALELAATRVRGLGVHGLAARLDDRFRVLGVGRRGVPARQQTLRAMIDWSWELLGAAERIVLRRLAIHVDGSAPEAAEAVCSGDDVARADVLDLVGRLVDRSLVVVVEGPYGPRYRLLESVAAYCVERLHAAGEFDAVQGRHDGWVAELVEYAGPRLYGPDQREWLTRLDAEGGNLRSALDGAARRADAGLAVRLAGGAAWYRFLRGRYREAWRALDAALAVRARPDSDSDSDSRAGAGAGAVDPARVAAGAWRAGFAMLIGDGRDLVRQSRDALRAYDGIVEGRARAEWFLGLAHLHVGDADAGGELIERALVGFRAADDAWGIAAALTGRAKAVMFRGDPAAAGAAAEDAAARFAALGERWGLVQASDQLAYVAEVSGEYDRAAALHREGLCGAEELGLWTDVSYRWSGLGRIALLRGDFARAEEFHERGRRLAVERSDRFAEEFAEVGLGLGARRAGDLVAAERHLRNALEWNRRLHDDYGVPFYGVTLLLAELGFVAELRGDAVGAREWHEEGLAAARASGDPRAVALALEGLAGVEAISGRAVEAATLLGRADALRASIGAPLPVGELGDVTRIAAAAREALGPSAYAIAFGAGVDSSDG